MIKKLLSFVIMASAVCILSSCLKDKEDEVTYYNDTAVTAFSLGTLKQYHHTTAKDGITDSVYTTTYNAKTFSFCIDQTQKLIYNLDSLPYGTDASKVLTSITTKNSAVAMLNLKDKSGKDSMAYYNPKDSLDFSEPTRLRVYNMHKTAFREYVVKVNVHRQTGDEMPWSYNNVAALDGVAARKMIENGGTMYLFGIKEGKTVVFRQDGNGYTQLATSFGIKAYKNVIAMNGSLYLLDDNTIMQSHDGIKWAKTGSSSNLKQLIGASTNKLYALTDKGIVSSANHGATWDDNTLDDDAANLPVENINFMCIPAKTNAKTNTLIIIGMRNGQTMIWRKVEENAEGAQNQPWAFYPPDQHNKHPLPALTNLQVIGYDNALLALGGDFNTFYSSKDQGLTWFATDSYKLPSKLSHQTPPFAMTCDSKNMIYITQAGKTIINTGRLARLGWARGQKIFIE